MIYFVRDISANTIKIGWSKKPEKRLQTLQVGHASKLILARLVDWPRSAEKWLHSSFSHLHVGGEWFQFEPCMLEIKAPDIPDEIKTPSGSLTRINIDLTESDIAFLNSFARERLMSRTLVIRHALKVMREIHQGGGKDGVIFALPI